MAIEQLVSRIDLPWDGVCFHAGFSAMWLVLAVISTSAADNAGFETKGFQAKGFKVADHYGPPYETQIKSLLQGGKATPLSGGKTLLSDGVTLQTFTETNTLQLIVKAPQCLYDSVEQTASSAGPLRVQLPDGRFSTEGEGFLWRQTNSSLFISNHVHTLVHSDALQSPATNPQSKKSGTEAPPTDIVSDRFSYESSSSEGIYRGNVRATDPNLNLTGGILRIEFPRSARQVQSVTAEQDVLIDYLARDEKRLVDHIRAKGERADFSSRTGLIQISGGHPSWSAGSREGRADELIIDRTNEIFQANGHAWLKMSGQGLGSAGLLSRQELSSKNPRDSTNTLVDVLCDNYELRTNLGVFRQDVRVSERAGDELRGKMGCSLMTLTFASSNELQTLCAETNVVIEQGTNRFAGGKAVYTATNGMLELTEDPTWQAGPKAGKGDLIRVNTQLNEMLVRGNASMRLPADEFASNLTPASPGQKIKPPSKPGTNQFAEIFCEEYTLRTNSSSFRGGVHACHPRMEWVCENLIVQSPASGQGQPQSIVAERGVKFDLEKDNGEKVHGTGDKAVYTFAVSDTVTNDLLTLTGDPATLVTTNGTNSNDRIIYDRANNSLSMPGANYRIEGVGPAMKTNTNLFALPKHKSRK